MTGPHVFGPASEKDEPPFEPRMAEHAVVGALLANNKHIDLVSDFLRAEHFHDPLLARIYEDVLRIAGGGGIADVITLNPAYVAEGLFEHVGGAEYLPGVMAAKGSPLSLRSYAEHIVDRWRRRRADEIARDLPARLLDRLQEHAAAEILGEVSAEIAGLADQGQREGGAMFGDALARTLKALQDEASQRDRPLGLSTGIGALDDHLQGGLHPGQLVVIGGRPGHGKTTLALQIALRAAQSGVGVAFYALEMLEDEMMRRSLAHLADDHRLALRLRNRSLVEWTRIREFTGEFGALPLHIDDRKRPTVGQIALRLRAVQRRMKVGLVVVDYLGLMAPPLGMERAQQHEQLSATTGTLKAMAGELGVPLVLAAQLNRNVEAREDKRPTASDFRGSGSVEQDADAALLVFREEIYLKEREPQKREGESEERFVGRVAAWRDALARARGRIEIIVSKFRQGDTGLIRAHYAPGTFRISDGEGRP